MDKLIRAFFLGFASLAITANLAFAAVCSVNNGLIQPPDPDIQLNGVAGVPGLVIGVGEPTCDFAPNPCNDNLGVVYVNGVAAQLPNNTAQLNGVSVASTNYAVAVGDEKFGTTPLVQFDGTTWTAMPTTGTVPSQDANGVKTYGPNQTYVVGDQGIYFFDGTTWTRQFNTSDVPNVNGQKASKFEAIWGGANVYALADNGALYTKAAAALPTTWTRIAAAYPAGANKADFQAITGDAAGNVYVTGQTDNNKGFIYQYNPTTEVWTNLITTAGTFDLNGIAINPVTGAITAVGDSGGQIISGPNGVGPWTQIPEANNTNDINAVYIDSNGTTYLAGQTVDGCTVPVTGPEYRMDEAGWNGTANEVVDSSGNALHGMAMLGATTATAKICNGANLSANYVEVPDNALLDITSALTVAAWIKPARWGGGAGNDALMTFLSKDTNYEAHIDSAGHVFWWWGTGSMTSTVTVPVGSWTHVALVYANGSQTIYINGVARGTAAFVGALPVNALPFQIGDDQGFGGGTRRFDGMIDEVKIFNGAMTGAQISTGYANENLGKNWDGTARTCPSYGPDHYELSLPTSGITCLPTTATVTACADNTSPCANPLTTMNGKTATLATTAGTLGSATVTFNASGVASTTLSYPAATDGATATVTLSGEQAAAANSRQCCPDGANCVVADNCSTAFHTAGFVVSGSAGGSVATIANQVAGASSGTYYLRAVKTLDNTSHTCGAALTGANIPVNFAYECVNPATCYASDLLSVNGGASTVIARNDSGSVTSYASVNMTFDANGNAPFTLNYGDVGQVKLWVSKTVSSALLTGSSNVFVVKPDHFELSAIQQTVSPNLANPAAANAAGSKFVKAGEQFSVTVTAKSSSGATTPNYGKESPAENVTLTSALVAGLGLTNNPALGGAFGAFTNGVATGTNFTWNEVGIITLTPSIADGDYLGAGDVSGTASGNVGRFYAAQFALSGGVIANRSGLAGCAAPAGCGSFTYMGEEMSAVFRLTAQAVDGTRLQNYVDTFAKFNPVTGLLNLDVIDNPLSPAVRTPLGARVSVAGLPAVTGQFLSTCAPAPACLGAVNVVTPFMISRGANADGPYAALDVGIAPQDSDGATLVYNLDTTNVVAGANNHALVGRTEVRYGRIRLSNAHGSELLPLPLIATVQFWNGAFWVTSATDSVTSLTLAATYDLLNKSGTITGTTTPTPTGAATVANGILGINLSKPTGGAGSATVNPTVPGYLPLTGGLATFGVYRGNNEFIYLRENY